MLVSTSESNGLCFIETAELDGETNLKVRQALEETCGLEDHIDQLSSFDGRKDQMTEMKVKVKEFLFQRKLNTKHPIIISGDLKEI